jgi:hypothetical protein
MPEENRTVILTLIIAPDPSNQCVYLASQIVLCCMLSAMTASYQFILRGRETKSGYAWHMLPGGNYSWEASLLASGGVLHAHVPF